MAGKRLLIDRAKELIERGNYTEAVESLSRLAEEHPQYADVRNYLGLALHFAGHSEEAIEQFRKALGINTRYTEAHLNLALVLNDMNRLEEARVSFQEAAESEQVEKGALSRSARAKLANMHADLADLYAQHGRYAEAAEEYRRALALEPGFNDIRSRLARSYLEAGSYTLAASELGKVLAQNPEDVRARLDLGLVHFRQGDRDRARTLWEECGRLDSGNPAVKVYLAML